MILSISATTGCAKGGCRCVGGALPAHLPIRPFSEGAVIVRTLALLSTNPLPRTLPCASLKGRRREHAETRRYLFVLDVVPSLPPSKASIHREEASCPTDLRARINSEHFGRHSTSRHCGTISDDHEPLNPLRPQRCISLSSATPSPSGHPFRTSPTWPCSPMASQMSCLRHQERNIKASTDRLRELLRPVVKAYVLGYASSTTPRLLTLLVTLVTRKSKDVEGRKFQRALFSAYRILRGGVELQRFPTFCAALIGGASLLQVRRSCGFSFSHSPYACPICMTAVFEASVVISATTVGHSSDDEKRASFWRRWSSDSISIVAQTNLVSLEEYWAGSVTSKAMEAKEADPRQAQ